MFEEREMESFSSSTSKADDHEFDDVPPGTYCVWNTQIGSDRFHREVVQEEQFSWVILQAVKASEFAYEGQSYGKEPAVIFLATSKRTNQVSNYESNMSFVFY